MDQTTAFSPPLVCELLDGSRIKFARATMDLWVTLSTDFGASRVKLALAEIEKDPTLKTKDKAELRILAHDSIVPLHQVMNQCVTNPTWIKLLLVETARAAGHTEDEAKKALSMIPPMDQIAIANQVAMLAVVKNVKRGTDSDPLRPGVDLDRMTANDSTSGENNAPSSESTDSTPAD